MTLTTLYTSLGISMLLNIAYWALTNKMIKEKKECIEYMNDLKDALERENYLLKTMNDALKVVDIGGFMAQRMSMAPRRFKPKTEEEIKPDNIES